MFNIILSLIVDLEGDKNNKISKSGFSFIYILKNIKKLK